MGADQHPDAFAVRLRISLLAAGCEGTMQTTWDQSFQLERYIEFRRKVSAGCRLTPEEECSLVEQVSGA